MSARTARRLAKNTAIPEPEVDQFDPIAQDDALLDQDEDVNPADELDQGGVINIEALLGKAGRRPVNDENDDADADEEVDEDADEEPEKEFVRKPIALPVDEEDDEILEELEVAPVATPAPVSRRRVAAPVEEEPEAVEEPAKEPAAPLSAKNRRRLIVVDDEEEQEPAKETVAPVSAKGRRRLIRPTEDEEAVPDMVEKTDTRKDADHVAPTENRRKIKRDDEASAAQSAPTPKNDVSGSASGGLLARRAATKAAAAAASAPATKPVKVEKKEEEAPVESLVDKYRRLVESSDPLEALEEIFPDARSIKRASQEDFDAITNNVAGILGFVCVESVPDDGIEVALVPTSAKKGKKTFFTHACVLYGSCLDQNERLREDSKPFALSKDTEFVSEEEFDIGFYVLDKEFADIDIFALIKKTISVLRARK